MTDEIVLYQPDESVQLEVRVQDESVWLNLNQMSLLFGRDKSVVSRHIKAIFQEGELVYEGSVAKNATVQIEGERQVVRDVEYYNLNVIISVGYRVKSQQGTAFRIWANKVLKDYMLRGYAVNQRMLAMEERMDQRLMAHERRLEAVEEQIDFFVRTSLPPVEQVFFEGEFFEARVLSLRDAHNASKDKQPINTHKWTHASHDRWLIVDDRLYHCGHSLKDMGKKLSAITLMGATPETILDQIA